MDTVSAIRARRSIRRFLPKPVPAGQLKELVELARLYAPGGNVQPLRYAIVQEKSNTDRLFAGLKWAMYLPDFAIAEDQRPSAYIVLLRDDRVKKNCQFDLGAAATNIMLAAQSMGLASCCLASFSRKGVSELLRQEEDLVPELVIALGYADQESRAVAHTGDDRYFETADGVLNVPKLSPEQVLIFSDFVSA